MAPLALRVLLLAAGASCLRMDISGGADGTNATEGRGKRRRTGQAETRAPNGRSYVYVAGVPGTGHEFWKGVLRRCVDAEVCQPRAFPFYTGLLFGNEGHVNESWVKSDKQHPDRIVPMNLVSPDLDRQPDDAFFRAFASKVSNFENPRLPLYHKLARSNGDGFKVVVLTRNSEKELLAWNMKKYKLSEEEADARLAVDIRTLAMQLIALPADSYRCVSFEEMLAVRGPDLKPLSRLADVRAEAFSLRLHHRLTTNMYGCGFTGQGITSTWDCPHMHVKAPKVRAALDLLEDLCDPADLAAATKPLRQKDFATKVQWLME